MSRRKPTKIDLQAFAAPKRNWTPQEEDVIEQLYGLEKPETIQKRILKETGSPRSIAAIIVRAQRLGLDHRTAPGEFTVREAAEELGVTMALLYHRIGRGLIRSTGRGRCRFIPIEEMERLQQEFPTPPARSMTRPEAMRALGYGEAHMSRLLIAGAIRAVKRGERWYVDADHVEELVDELKRTGATRLTWGPNDTIEANRASYRDYYHAVRKKRRQEDREHLYYTKNDARHVLGVGRDEMTRLLETGIVRGKRENGLWLAERAHVDELAQRRREVGA
jgi:hypothetical protein